MSDGCGVCLNAGRRTDGVLCTCVHGLRAENLELHARLDEARNAIALATPKPDLSSRLVGGDIVISGVRVPLSGLVLKDVAFTGNGTLAPPPAWPVVMTPDGGFYFDSCAKVFANTRVVWIIERLSCSNPQATVVVTYNQHDRWTLRGADLMYGRMLYPRPIVVRPDINISVAVENGPACVVLGGLMNAVD